MAAADVSTAALEAFNARDLDRVVTYMAPSVVLDTTHLDAWPEASLYYGHAGFLRFSHEWLDQFDDYRLDVEEQTELSPGCVFTDYWQRAHGVRSQVPVEMHRALVTTVSDGLITRVELWSDPGEARAAAAVVGNYDRFMGRYAVGLARKLADAADVRAGMRVLDVGCGPGALTLELAGRVGAENVAAIDPSSEFAGACRARVPGADVREGVAESLPWEDGAFDAAMCSLVVAWMSDADQGIAEMARVVKPGGTVAAAMWDFPGGGLPMLSYFWNAARAIDPSVGADDQPRAGVTEGDLVERFARAGLQGVTGGTLETSVDYADFDDYWKPFTSGGGPSTGAFYASLDDAGRATLRDAARASLPAGPFTLPGRAWLALGTAPG